MSKRVELEVEDAGRFNDLSQVPLTEGQMNDLGTENEPFLSGERVTIVGPEGSLEGLATPATTGEENLPLSPAQRDEIGVSVGGRVEIERGTKPTTSSSPSSISRPRSRSNDSGRETEDETDLGETGGTKQSFGDITYEDVGGLDSELDNIRQMVELPLQRPDLFEDVGVEPPSGVLLHGPPGTGKTLIAQAIANETNARFNKIDGPEIMSKYTGESEERLRKIFEDARQQGTAIIFFDEIDSIGTQRDDGGDVENRLVGQLLSLMDGLDSSDNVIVIGATNRADTLDPALRRSGRFDREILIGAPNEKGRKEILEIHTDEMPLAEDVDLDALAGQTNGFVGADLAALAREAALEAIKNTYEGDDVTVEEVLEGKVDGDVEVTMQEINRAMSRVDPSALRSMSAKTPSVTFEDVGGLEEEKQRMEEIVSWPLERTKLFNETNTDSPAGVLVEGPEGVGKTLLSEATAGEFDVNFTRVNGASIFQKYVGESEEQVQDLFKTAEKASPVIIFFEQLDAVAGLSADMSGAQERVISQLLVELDAIRNDPTMTVIGETTDSENIDPRLLQAGRFEETLEIDEPDGRTRRQILEVLTEDKPLSEDVSLGEIAAPDGDDDPIRDATGGDLEAIVRNASLKAIREHAKEEGSDADESAEDIEITEEHFQKAKKRVFSAV
jgi:transitional endoplasmic reticulum ATPase